ncbi:MAG: thioesterase family protein [Anaerolineae bacterium]|jgi:acyl-CoA thioester hydrolase|nr:thioesterase family protein [Anaerolineae bacterium]
MREFRHFLPISVRYSDIDAQGHVNNTRFGTYIESGRLAYVKDLGLWDGKDFFNLGLIVADVHIAYLRPILFGQGITVATRVAHIGNKSMKFEFQILNETSGDLFATAETVNVGFDYNSGKTITISPYWRKTISAFEGVSFSE